MLSNRDIRRRIEAGDLIIDPPPADAAFGGASVDLTLSTNIRIINPSRCAYIDYARIQDDPEYLTSITDAVDLAEGQPLILHPGRVVICSTVERVRVPVDICAELHGRSSLARLGVLPHTAGKVDPGWDGTLTLEVSNLGEIPVALYPGEAVCQMVFHELSSPADLSSPRAVSRYQGQTGPTLTSPRRDGIPTVWPP
ncbi:MAG TPA: dCTP deaminase [Dehalococcoidia bacterium]|nr:dCTP deaminase [Dehalococcoidia bacterium]